MNLMQTNALYCFVGGSTNQTICNSYCTVINEILQLFELNAKSFFLTQMKIVTGPCINSETYDCDNLGALNISGTVNYRNTSCFNFCCTQLTICNTFLCNSQKPVTATTTTKTTITTTPTTTTTTTPSITNGNSSSKNYFSLTVTKLYIFLILEFSLFMFRN